MIQSKVEKGSPDTGYTVRLYSIASPSHSFGKTKDTLELVVKRDNEYDSQGNILHKGVCSNYICDLKVGDPSYINWTCWKKILAP
jgi:ferredoxin--NADP+ reductase